MLRSDCSPVVDGGRGTSPHLVESCPHDPELGGSQSVSQSAVPAHLDGGRCPRDPEVRAVSQSAQSVVPAHLDGGCLHEVGAVSQSVISQSVAPPHLIGGCPVDQKVRAVSQSVSQSVSRSAIPPHHNGAGCDVDGGRGRNPPAEQHKYGASSTVRNWLDSAGGPRRVEGAAHSTFQEGRAPGDSCSGPVVVLWGGCQTAEAGLSL